jgi:hypothetical protein
MSTEKVVITEPTIVSVSVARRGKGAKGNVSIPIVGPVKFNDDKSDFEFDMEDFRNVRESDIIDAARSIKIDAKLALLTGIFALSREIHGKLDKTAACVAEILSQDNTVTEDQAKALALNVLQTMKEQGIDDLEMVVAATLPSFLSGRKMLAEMKAKKEAESAAALAKMLEADSENK